MGLAVHDERLTLRVGATTLLLGAALVVGLVALDRCELRPRFAATVYFEHTGTLREGAHVQVAGRIIGEVTDISLVPAEALANPAHPLHRTGGVTVRIRLQRRHAAMAPVNGEYFLSAKGLMGEPFLEIGPPADGQPRGRALQPGDAVRGVDAPRIDRALWRSYASMKLSQAFLAELVPEARALGRALDQLGATLNALADQLDEQRAGQPAELDQGFVAPWRALVGELRALGQTWSRSELRWEEVSAVAGQARRTMDRAVAVMAEMQERVRVLRAALNSVGARVPDGLRARLEAALAQAEASLDRVANIVAGVNTLVANIEGGQGTIGALLTDPEFSDDAKQLGKLIKRHPWRVIAPPPRE